MSNKISILDLVPAYIMDMYRVGALPFYLHQFLPLQLELLSFLGSKFVMFYEIHCGVSYSSSQMFLSIVQNL